MLAAKSVLAVVAVMASLWSASLAMDDERFAPLFATRGSGPPATFEETRDAVHLMWDEIGHVVIPSDYTDEDNMSAEQLEATKQMMGALVEVCHFEKANCHNVFRQIEKLRMEIDGDLINLTAYLQNCFEQQRIYCMQ